MSDGVTALVFSVGFGGWIYAMMMRSTSSQQSSLVGAGVAAFGAFVVIFSLMKFILHF